MEGILMGQRRIHDSSICISWRKWAIYGDWRMTVRETERSSGMDMTNL